MVTDLTGKKSTGKKGALPPAERNTGQLRPREFASQGAIQPTPLGAGSALGHAFRRTAVPPDIQASSQSTVATMAVQGEVWQRHVDARQPIQLRTTTVDGTTYLHLDAIPATRYVIVRTNWRPRSSRRLLNTNTNQLLQISMTANEANDLRAVMTQLGDERVGDLDGLLKNVDDSFQKGIATPVVIARLAMIRENIHDVVLARLRADHAQLKATGLLSALIDDNFDTAFENLEIPGSDPHKHGQVVVFANYQNADGLAERVVYKPGELWLDKLLFGDDPASVATKLGGDIANYKILLKKDAGQDTPHHLEDYSYMEFAKGTGPQTKAEIESVYRSVGDCLALAYTYGLRDIHHENFILQRDKILLIDMEAATGTYTGFSAMEFGRLPGELASRIGKGLVGKTRLEVGNLLDDLDLAARVREGFGRTMDRLGAKEVTDDLLYSTSETVAQGRTRIVPFATEDLQRIAGDLFGKLGRDDFQESADLYEAKVDNLVTTAAATMGIDTDTGKDQLLALLNSQATIDAFNRGDVPYWQREGDKIYDEAGNLCVESFEWSRVKSKVLIDLDIYTRGIGLGRGGALDDLNAQVVPVINPAANQIINAHFGARINAGHDD